MLPPAPPELVLIFAGPPARGGRVAQAFDLADITNTGGAPSLRSLQGRVAMLPIQLCPSCTDQWCQAESEPAPPARWWLLRNVEKSHVSRRTRDMGHPLHFCRREINAWASSLV